MPLGANVLLFEPKSRFIAAGGWNRGMRALLLIGWQLCCRSLCVELGLEINVVGCGYLMILSCLFVRQDHFLTHTHVCIQEEIR